MGFTVLPFCLLVCLFHVTSGIYFHLSDSKPLCFIQDVPDETLVQGVYRVENFCPKSHMFRLSGHTFHVNVRDPNSEVILARAYSSEGQFVFTSHKGGEYRICVSSDPSSWLGSRRLRVHLDIWTADHAINYGEVASRDRLNDLQLRVRQLSDQVQTIAKDQNYQRVREEYFRQLSESTSKRVTYWSIAQLVLLGLIGFWQMRHLRSFFQAKKLV
ncbi:p24 family protein alpha [Paragonimus westermani]|uniref:p24 family protein alpha n=1 Tax=Paragonimus westermani TaxID=34504 RepID=A0A5J4NTS3_9TREM|nr:p24 family protein alpha [Paragonimus westermani]